MDVPGGRLVAGLALLGALLVGCGPGAPTTVDPPPVGTVEPGAPPTDDPGVPAPPTDDPVSAPPSGAETEEPDGPGEDGGPSLSLPRLPVGGVGTFVDPASQDLQCAPISWTAFGGRAGLDRGVQVEVVGYQVDTAYFSVAADGCDEPSCAEFVFDSSATGCTVGVRTVRPRPAGTPVTDLVLIGRARCDAVSPDVCADFVAAVVEAAGDASTIDLVAPDVPWPSDSAAPPSGEPTDAPTEAVPTDAVPTDAVPTV